MLVQFKIDKIKLPCYLTLIRLFIKCGFFQYSPLWQLYQSPQCSNNAICMFTFTILVIITQLNTLWFTIIVIICVKGRNVALTLVVKLRIALHHCVAVTHPYTKIMVTKLKTTHKIKKYYQQVEESHQCLQHLFATKIAKLKNKLSYSFNLSKVNKIFRIIMMLPTTRLHFPRGLYQE